jgi:hypothetical protein
MEDRGFFASGEWSEHDTLFYHDNFMQGTIFNKIIEERRKKLQRVIFQRKVARFILAIFRME